jgi:hypothetical protein
MVSQKRLDLGIPLRNTGPDLAILFLAMKLVTTTPDEKIDIVLYQEAKSFSERLQADGTISLLMLQAMVLIAVYEYGHAIYPAAWMTIGACVRYSDALGLGPAESSLLGQVVRLLSRSSCISVLLKLDVLLQTTWTEAEERNRVWWSVYILDKLVAMGSKRRCILPEPPADNKLPVNDEHWVSYPSLCIIAVP